MLSNISCYLPSNIPTSSTLSANENAASGPDFPGETVANLALPSMPMRL